ncbi:MAG: hypothetical protein ABIQ01_13340, partial [Pseudolysinimonas sp.]
IKVDGPAGSGNKDITLQAATTIDPNIKVVLQTPGKVTVNGTSSLSASIVSGSLATSGAVTVG